MRYWSASARPGVDTAFDEQVMKVGRRLAVKLLNASKFVLNLAEGGDDAVVTEPLDHSMLAALAAVVDEATVAFDHFDYARALERTEALFWTFTDDYVELVKARAYGEGGDAGAASARAALRQALSCFQRLFAPHLPFVTDETWSWWQEGSVHQAPWPTADRLDAGPGDPEVLDVVGAVLSEIRRAKTEAKRSLRTEVAVAEVTDTGHRLDLLAPVRADVMAAGRVVELRTTEGPELSVRCELGS